MAVNTSKEDFKKKLIDTLSQIDGEEKVEFSQDPAPENEVDCYGICSLIQ